MPLMVDPGRVGFAGTIALSCRQVPARTVAFVTAAATENRILGLPGFVGAVLFTDEERGMVFELVLWTSPGAVGAVRGDHRFGDHMAVLGPHVGHAMLCFSPLLLAAAPVAFGRGDQVGVSAALVPNGSPSDVTAALGGSGALREGVLVHLAPVEAGVMAVSMAPHAAPPPPPAGAEERWRGAFRVVESFRQEEDALGLEVPYRLLPAGEAGAHGRG